MRSIILHYHLFKNAGTSLDQILKRNFGNRWVTAEFPMDGENNTPQVEEWIRSNPDAVAFSTHTAVGPIPHIDGVNIISVLLLRNPYDRIASAYRFERGQDVNTWGAQIAKETDLEGYVETRLGRPNDRQCRNFHSHRLATLVRGDGSEHDRAVAAMDRLSVVGVVEKFDTSMKALADIVTPEFPGFSGPTVRTNVSEKRASDTSPRLMELLEENNQIDMALWNTVLRKMGG